MLPDGRTLATQRHMAAGVSTDLWGNWPMCVLVVFWSCFDDALSDVQQFGVRFLGQPSQQCEGLYGIDPEAFHDDALGLADEVTAGDRAVHLFGCLGTGHGDRGVLGKDLAVEERVVIEDARLAAIEVERSEVVLMDE